MAAEASLSPPSSRFAVRVPDALLLILLLLVYVGIEPFRAQDPAITAFGETGVSGAGNILREISYLAVFLLVLMWALYKEGTKVLAGVPALVLLLLAWCLLSALWAAVPGITIRRAGLAVIVVLSTMLSVRMIGSERSLVLWRCLLAGVLIVNWLSIPLVPTAVHLAGEADAGLVGDWRGLFGHKNIAGSVCAISFLLFFFAAIDTRKRVFTALAIGAIGFLIMTRSKSSLGLLPLALGGGIAYRLAWKKDLDRIIAVVALSLVLSVAVTLLIVNWSAITGFLADPSELTGRTEIWHAEIAYIRDHPLLGAGFGSFYDTGGLSPLHNYITSSWVEHASHGHNGYLQILVTIGGTGFAIALVALIIRPASIFWHREDMALEFKSTLFAIFVFLALHNFMESDFLEGDGVSWVSFLLVLAMLTNAHSARPYARIVPLRA